MEKANEVIQVTNLIDNRGGWKNPHRGRVYSIFCVAPAVSTCQGGGQVPKIIVKRKKNKDIGQEPHTIWKGRKIVNLQSFYYNTTLRFMRNSALNVNMCACIKASGGGVTAVALLKKSNNMDKEEYYYDIRRLTPRECLRLMDVDERHIDTLEQAMTTTNSGKPKRVLSDSSLYKLAGNSIVVSCMTEIFESLLYQKDYPEHGDQLILF